MVANPDLFIGCQLLSLRIFGTTRETASSKLLIFCNGSTNLSTFLRGFRHSLLFHYLHLFLALKKACLSIVEKQAISSLVICKCI